MPFDPDEYLKNKTQQNTPQPVAPAPQGFDPDSYLASKSQPNPLVESAKAIGKGILGAVGTAGEYVDRYTGAPVRAAIGSLQNDLDPSKAISAYGSQFGEPTSSAPTGKQIVEKAGVPSTPLSQYAPSLFAEPGKGKFYQPEKGGPLDVSPSGVAGLGVDIAADPLVLAGSALKAGGMASEKLAGAIGKAAETGGEAAAKTVGKIGSTTTGLAPKAIESYVKRSDAINNLIKEFGIGKNEGAVADAADQIRQTFSNDIRQAKTNINNQISQSINKLDQLPSIESKPILEALEAQKSKLHPVLDEDAIANIDNIKDKISKVAGEDNLLTPKEAYQTQRYLQDIAAPSYGGGGQIFQYGKQEQLAAKNAAREARLAVNKALPEVGQANNQLSQLHAIEDNLNKNLITPEKSESALLSAGRGSNPRSVKMLKKLEDFTGTPMLQKAEDLAAANDFGKAGLLPMSGGGTTSTSRTLEGLAGGAMLGHAPGAALGAVLTSPLALKKAIDVAKSPKTYGLLKGAQTYSAAGAPQ